MYDLIIENANLVTCDKNHKVIKKASMGIADGKIKLIESSAAKTQNFSASQKIDARGKIVMPGLINMHCHAADSLFRGLVEELPLEAWLEKVWVAEKAILTPKTTYTGSILGLAENLLSGVTTVMDMFWYPTEAVKAAHDLGMRISTGGIFLIIQVLGVDLIKISCKKRRSSLKTIMTMKLFSQQPCHTAHIQFLQNTSKKRKILQKNIMVYFTYMQQKP